MSNTHDRIVAYGLHLMDQVTGVAPSDPPQPGDLGWTRAFERLLGTWPEPKADAALTSIFSRVYLPEPDQEDRRTAVSAYLRPAPLEMGGETPFPQPRPPQDLTVVAHNAGERFKQDYAGLRRRVIQAGDPSFFITFYHLMERFAWALPNAYGEPGVSLFQQWKAVAAMVFASPSVEDGPLEGFTLVGGDIPGIQRTIYTITSKGAAKALRGRSLFVQLLGDAVVRRLVHELKLSHANVIYAAGGNFMLLAPPGDDTHKVLRTVHEQVNRTLLDTYDGDIALCLASVPLPAEEVGTAEFGHKYSLQLKQAVARQKARRFADTANGTNGWQHVFEPKGGGGERAHFCAVCQTELSADELRDKNLLLVDAAELEPGETAPRACGNCATFRELAETVGHSCWALYLNRDTEPGDERWQQLLNELSAGWCYRFASWDLSPVAGETKYTINNTDFVNRNAHGFVFLANTTPRVTQADVEWWNEAYPEKRDQIEVGYIRSFELLANAARVDGALERVGVLRMDVDSLGKVMTRGLYYAGDPNRSMAATSALSTALDRFFAGHLDVLCRKVTDSPNMAGLPEHIGEDLLYVIYAGGDDLFVVGSWHLLPLLAEQVRDAFQRYTGDNPFLHISAAITLEGRKFPLYQAASRAGKALDGGAKKHTYVELVQDKPVRLSKNAIDFLDCTVGWSEFAEVRKRAHTLVALIKEKGLPRGLLHTLQMIHSRFIEERRMALSRGLAAGQAYYGPWMWRQAYTLGRLRRRHKEAAEDIQALQEWILKHVSHLGMAACWAEYLTRGKEG